MHFFTFFLSGPAISGDVSSYFDVGEHPDGKYMGS